MVKRIVVVKVTKMALDLRKLYEVITALPEAADSKASALGDRLEQEMNRQKQLFNNNLKKRGLNIDNPVITSQQKNKIKQATISYTIGLYQEMSQGLSTCAKEIENRYREEPSVEGQVQLIAVQKQLEQVASKMAAYAQALQTEQKTRDTELAKQRELDKHFIDLERKKEKEKELAKEQRKAKEWDKLLNMLLPPALYESWQVKTQEKLALLTKELGCEIKAPEKILTTKTEAKPVVAMEKKALALFDVLVSKAPIVLNNTIDTQTLPITTEAKLRKAEENKKVTEYFTQKINR